MMDSLDITIDAIGSLVNLLNDSNEVDNSWKHDIIDNITNINTNTNTNNITTIDMAMILLKNQISNTKPNIQIFDTLNDLYDNYTNDDMIMKSILSFEKTLLLQLLNSNNQQFVTQFNQIVDNINNNHNTNTNILRAINVLNEIITNSNNDWIGNSYNSLIMIIIIIIIIIITKA